MRLRIGLIAPLVLACGVAAPGPTTQPTTPPTASPASTSTPTAAPTAPPTAVPTDGKGDVPPDGLLTADGDPVAGWLGTFCWGSTCRDTPQVSPKAMLPQLSANATSQLTFALADGTTFFEWRASFSALSNDDVTKLGEGGADYDPYSSASPPPELTEVTFPAPPRGDWVVHVSVYVADGDASYAWHVTVP